MTTLVWYRNDLRTHFHRPLAQALSSGNPVRALYFHCPGQWQAHAVAPVRQRYVLRALLSLGETLAGLGVPLDVREVADFDAVPQSLAEYVREHGITEVLCSREYPYNELQRDRQVASMLEGEGVAINGFDDSVLVPPRTLKTGQGGWYSVFTPYRKRWQAWLEDNPPGADPLPDSGRKAVAFEQASEVQAWLDGFADQAHLDRFWPASESAVRERLATFVKQRLGEYHTQRDLPAVEGTSGLSAALSCGVLSPAECYRLARKHGRNRTSARDGADTWISELAWRDFYRQIMANHPQLAMGAPYRDDTRFIQWSRDEKLFQAWCEGRTGYPLVDAAMRQLRDTGWMHNRLRMVTAMFLTKNLFIDWRWGEQWFMQHLVDGDFAANNGGWQWSASTGTDAAPYFRVFNPVRQGERFDPDGDFIRQYVPELAALAGKAVHKPWKHRQACPEYPQPVVSLEGVRETVTAAFQAAKDIARQKEHA